MPSPRKKETIRIDMAVIVTGMICLLAGPPLPAQETMKEPVDIVAEASSEVEKPGWVLTLRDEFDGPDLDTARWHVFYRDAKANYVIKEGILHLRIDKALPVAGANKTFRCSSIQTVAGTNVWPEVGKDWPDGRPFSQRYGWFEIKARCCKGSGRHSAFWMMPADPGYLTLKEDGGMRESTNEAIEVDIFEQLGGESMFNHFTVHFGRSYSRKHKSENRVRKFPFDHSKDFHVYALEWTDKNLIWYVDGKEAARSNKAPRQPFFIFLSVYETMPDKKGWSGMLEHNPSYPCDFEIDYVRVYQHTDKGRAVGQHSPKQGDTEPGTAGYRR